MDRKRSLKRILAGVMALSMMAGSLNGIPKEALELSRVSVNAVVFSDQRFDIASLSAGDIIYPSNRYCSWNDSSNRKTIIIKHEGEEDRTISDAEYLSLSLSGSRLSINVFGSNDCDASFDNCNALLVDSVDGNTYTFKPIIHTAALTLPSDNSVTAAYTDGSDINLEQVALDKNVKLSSASNFAVYNDNDDIVGIAAVENDGSYSWTGLVNDSCTVKSFNKTVLNDITVAQSGSTDYIGYNVKSRGLNFYGIENNSTIRVAYSDNGFYTNLVVSDNEDYSGSKTYKFPQNTNFVFGKVYTYNGIQVRITPRILDDEKTLRLTYDIKNLNSSKKYIKIGSSGDTAFDNNDRCPIEKTASGLKMTNQRSDGTSKKFNLALSDTSASGSWGGNLGDLNSNLWADGVAASIGDSAMSYHWNYALESDQEISCSTYASAGDFYVMDFNTNGGSTLPPSLLSNTSVTAAPTPPTKKGCDFDGWYADAELTTPYEFGSTVTGDVTVYAKWKLNTYTVSFDANEGEVDTATKQLTHTDAFGELPTPVRNGYDFTGWFTAKTAGTNVTSETIFDSGENITLYAHWDVSVGAVSTGSLTFTGEDQALVKTDPVSLPDGLTVKYALVANDFAGAIADVDESLWGAEVPKGKNAGAYKVAYIINNGDTVVNSGFVNTNIAKATLAITGASASKPYDGTHFVFSDFTFESEDVEKLTALLSEEATTKEVAFGDTETPDDGKSLGAHKATITITNPNYTDINLTGEAVTAIITEADPDYTVPSGLKATYGQKLSEVTLSAAENGTWTWAEPTASVGNAGTNTFKAIFAPKDANYNTIQKDVSIEVSKANVTIAEAPSAAGIVYEKSLADSTLTGGKVMFGETPVKGTFTWKDGTVKPSVADGGKTEYAVVFTPANPNLNAAETKVTLAVEKATPACTVPKDLKITYGKTLEDIKLDKGWTWNDDVKTKLETLGENKFKATFTPEDTANYNTVTKDLTILVYVDKTALKTAISDTEAYTNGFKEEYHTRLFKDLNKALKNGKKVDESLTVTQDQIDTATADLEEALAYANKLVNEINHVQGLIDAIGEISYTDECKAKIDAAREAYDALLFNQQMLVKNYQVLVNAESEYEKLGIEKYRIFKVSGKAATHTESGLKTYWKQDGFNYEDDKCTKKIDDLETWIVIPAEGHNWGEWVTKVPATCTESGLAVRTCEEDEATETKVIPATGEHKFGEWKVKKAPTCTENGIEERVCAECGKTETREIKATGEHKYGKPVYTWSEDGKSCTATAVCEVDKKIAVTETAEVTSKVKTAATCDKAGVTTYTAKFKNELFSAQTKDVEDIPATGHKYGTPVYTWSEDGKSCTATAVCETDKKFTVTETVEVTSAVKTPATCDKKGVTTYTAKFKNKLFSVQTKDVEDIPATGEHKYGKPVYTWSEDGKSCTATAVCETDKKITVTETAEVTSAVKTAATCDKAGVTTYTAKFKNELFSVQTKDVEDVPATGHKYGKPVYTWSEDGKSCTATVICETDKKFTVTETVEVTSAVKIAATCDKAGVTTYTATFKNELFSAQTKDVEDIPATGHKFGEWTVTKEATEEADGCETRICEHCGKEETNVILATVHKMGEWKIKKPATCLEDGIEERACVDCGKTETRVIKAAGEHKFGDWTVVKEATCEETGLEVRKCENCDEEETRVIPATGHKFSEWKTVTKLTDEVDGLEVRTCEHCGREEARATLATGHEFGEWKVTEEPTCEKSGIETRYCDHNDGTFETREIPAIGHRYGAPVYTWSDDGKTCTATVTCEHDKTHVITEKAVITDAVKIAATCENKGVTTYTAKFENKLFSAQTKDVEDIPATGHKFGTPVYTWSADGSTCTAIAICETDKKFTVTEEAVITSAVKTAATCDKAGVTTYTALFKNELFSSQTKDIEDIPAAGHKYGTPVYTWSEDGKTCTATVTCEHDKTHAVTETAVITGAVKTAATCDKNGITTYTATFKNELFALQTKDVADIPATGEHKFGGWYVTITANAEHDGTKEHKCEVCGLTETASTSYDYHESADEVTDPENKPGEIRNITEPETNACSGTIEVTDKKDILDTFPLTNEECDQVENGKDIGLKLEVTDISGNEVVKEKADEAVKDTVGENGVVAAVLDVSIHKYIDGHDAGRVTQLNKVLRVYIDLPAGLYKEGRTFYVVREHEGKYEALPLTLVSETRAYFESDQYSQFYIVYTEAHEHEFGEWKTSQNASWLHRGYEERTCECGEKETRRVEESWTEWLVGAVGRRLRNLFH
jgi:uncharacterized repeat protein (TIGR02543 family)